MKHTIKITILLISIFLLAQFLGLLIIQNYIDVQKTAETGTTTFEKLPLGIERPPVQPQYSFIYIGAAVLIGTIILLILIKFQLKFIWKLWYLFAGFYVPYKRQTQRKQQETASAVLGGGDIAFPLLFTGTIFAQLGTSAYV